MGDRGRHSNTTAVAKSESGPGQQEMSTAAADGASAPTEEQPAAAPIRGALPLPANFEKQPIIMTYHHHHFYKWKSEPLTAGYTEDSASWPVGTNIDHSGHTHNNNHVQVQEPTCITLPHYKPSEPVEIEVFSYPLNCLTTLFVERDHLHYLHQIVHCHEIYCSQMWPDKATPPAPRLFFPDLQTRTMTKSAVFCQRIGTDRFEFHHYHTHWHTLMATADKHPESVDNPQP